MLESILDPNAVLAEGWKAPISAMPALGAFLSDAEVRNLVAFLDSLDGKRSEPTSSKDEMDIPPILPFLLVGILVLLLALRVSKD